MKTILVVEENEKKEKVREEIVDEDAISVEFGIKNGDNVFDFNLGVDLCKRLGGVVDFAAIR